VPDDDYQRRRRELAALTALLRSVSSPEVQARIAEQLRQLGAGLSNPEFWNGFQVVAQELARWRIVRARDEAPAAVGAVQTPEQLIDEYLTSNPQKPSARGLWRFRDNHYKQMKGRVGFGDTALKNRLYKRAGVTLNRGGRGSNG
jgi:hypothetical protein